MSDFETRIERIPLPIPPRLVVTTTDGTTELALSGTELTLGRGEDNDLVVMAEAVSRHHASLELREDGVLIKDLGSTNGIAVDGVLVPEALLGPDTEVTIGTSVTLTYLPPRSTADQLAAMLQTPAAAPEETGATPDASEGVTAIMPEAAAVAAEPAPEAVAVEAAAVEREPAPETEAVVVEEAVVAEAVVVEAEAEAEAEAVVEAEAEPEAVVEAEAGPEAEAVVEEVVVVEEAVVEAEAGPEAEAVVEEVVVVEEAVAAVEAEPEPAVVAAGAAVVAAAAVDTEPYLMPIRPAAAESPAAPAEQRPSQGWYLSCSGGGSQSRIGPCAWVDLVALGRDGAVNAGDYVWHESLVDWLPVEQLPELAEYLRQDATPEVAAAGGAPAPEPLAATLIAEPWEAQTAGAPGPAVVTEEAAPAASATAAGALDMATGWYMSRGEGASAWQGGPYAWEELVGFARDGRLAEGDLVWHEGYPAWVSPAEVPGLTYTTGAAW